MKKLLQKFTGWMVAKTNYMPELPLPIQAITIKPDRMIITPMEAKDMYELTGYIPNFIKNNDL